MKTWERGLSPDEWLGRWAPAQSSKRGGDMGKKSLRGGRVVQEKKIIGEKETIICFEKRQKKKGD